MSNVIQLKDGVVFTTRWATPVDKTGSPLPPQKIELPTLSRRIYSNQTSVSKTPIKYYQADNINHVFLKVQEVESVTYQLKELDSILPKTVDEEIFDSLNEDFKKRYEKIVTKQDKLVPWMEAVQSSNHNPIVKSFVKIDETISEYFTAVEKPGLITTYTTALERIFTFDPQKAIFDSMKGLKGDTVFLSEGRYSNEIQYLSEGWDGSTRKVLHKKQNGRPYADLRGHYVKDLKVIDTLNIPRIEVTLPSLNNYNRVMEALLKKIINPRRPIIAI